MSITTLYGRMHEAMQTAAKDADLEGTHIRVLVALLEARGSLTTEQLYTVPGINPTQVRRASLRLRAEGFVEATAADENGGPPRTGCYVRLTLTEAGRSIAEGVLAACGFPVPLQAVAA